MSEDLNEKCSDLSKRSAIILRSPNSGIESQALTPSQANTDEQLIELWLHGRSRHTKRAYQSDAARFIEFTGKNLQSISLADIQSFADDISESLQPPSVHRVLSSIKSLFAFGFRLGYFKFDVGSAMKLPMFRDKLADRILDEVEVLRMISLESKPRNRAILQTFYAGGFRVSEICSLKWKHLKDRELSGQVTVFSKGGKTRTVLMPKSIWNVLQSLQENANPEAPVFRSRKGGHLDESAVWRIVKTSAERAGIDKNVSCHWFRHAHASHALDRGCKIHVVQSTLGHSSISTTGRYLHARPSDSSGNYLTL